MLASLLLVTSLCLGLSQGTTCFAEEASALRGKDAWQELQDLAQKQVGTSKDDVLPLAYLAVAQAGLKNFASSTGTLLKLKSLGIELNQVLPGFGAPMVEVVNVTYAQCWANFDPAFNQECWLPLFEAFPESPYATVAASRLLMAALKTKNGEEALRFETFFAEERAKATTASDVSILADLDKRYVDGYLRAGLSNPRVSDLAQQAWSASWSAAKEKHGFNGPVVGGALTAEASIARLECELDTDHAFNTLAQASFLAQTPLQAGHPLFDMEAEPAVTFRDITTESGLEGIQETRVAAADFDQDGDPDLCFGGWLFENRKGNFVNVSDERGIKQHGSAAVFGDFDGDGDLDLLIASSPQPFLYRNLGKRGKFQFEDVSAEAGFSDVHLAAGAEGVSWVDFDDDGDLDIYFAVYEAGGEAKPDVLLENLGAGKFQDVSLQVKMNRVGPFCGRGVSPVDLDLDGDTEIFVSNYRLNENLFWQWDGSALNDISAESGIKGVREPADGQYFGHTIGSCWGDIDNDGDLDLFSANLAHPRFVRQGFSNFSMLGINQGDGTFLNEWQQRGIRFQETHSDPAFIDIDNDGDLDLSITCVYEGVSSALYQNDGSGHFQAITFRSGAAMFHGWGQAWLDVNGDGFLDVLYASSNGVRLLLNSGNANHYLRLRLQSKGKDAFANGATVRVETIETENPQVWMRQLQNARGTGSQDEPILQFGLGSYKGRLKVSVDWPDSDRTESKTPKSDRVFVMKQSRRAK
ncbi:MAG: CRTAC1 family protein [Planctomycetota bacterium]